jgi:hypothetical protein
MDSDNRQEGSHSLSAVPPDQIRFITARATVQEMTEVEQKDTRVAQAIRSAMHVPMVRDGEPTKLLVTSWMVHEGKNNNNLVFRAEDLDAAAKKMTAPNLLPMDWNHSAVVPQEGIPKAIGVWYAAEAKMDDEAYEGRGAMGIEAKGIVWAWAYPEYAEEMLRLQRDRGYVEFSMACIPTDVERGRDQNGPYEIAIEPVFFTLSALNLPPGDPDAKGVIENAHELPVPKDSMPERYGPARPYDKEYGELAEAALECLKASSEDESATADGDLEIAAVATVLSGAKGKPTDFPKAGDNKAVSLRNSQWKLFPLQEAADLKDNWPEIWRRGGNIRGNAQFRRLSPVAKRGGNVTTASEEYAVRLREAWVARHHEDFQLAGVVAQVKWLAVGSRGLDHMRSVLNEAKERVKARRAARKEEEHMENKDDLPQVALEAALEANSVLKAELDQAREGLAGVTAKLAELEASLTQLTARAEDAELQRDALQAELAEAAEALTNSTAALQASQEQLAAIAAEQDKLATKHRWEARFAELPESYRAAFAKRGDEEQARFTARWSAASDEAWAEFKSDLFVGFADAKLSYLKLSENEGVLPVGSDMDLGAKVSALIK